MFSLFIQRAAATLGLMTIPVGILLILNGNDDPFVVVRAMVMAAILCSAVWVVCHDLQDNSKHK